MTQINASGLKEMCLTDSVWQEEIEYLHSAQIKKRTKEKHNSHSTEKSISQLSSVRAPALSRLFTVEQLVIPFFFFFFPETYPNLRRLKTQASVGETQSF